jgi:serine/threonine protein phosphatase PrpC
MSKPSIGSNWRVLGASVVGVSHVAHGTPCQDAHAHRLLPGGLLAVAVADGAGSASRSDEGAKAAVEAALDALERIAREAGPDGLLDDVLTSDDGADDDGSAGAHPSGQTPNAWSNEVISFDGPSTSLQRAKLGAFDSDLSSSSEFAERDVPPDEDEAGRFITSADAADAASDDPEARDKSADADDTASTKSARSANPSTSTAPSPSPMRQAFASAIAAVDALAAAEQARVREFACTLTCVLAGESRIVVGQVGDCVAVAKDAEGAWTTVGMPQKEGEYANEAFFITQADSLERLEVEIFDIEAEALVLSSDGLLRLMLQLPAMAPHPPFLDPMLRFAQRTPVSAPLAAFLDSERVNARTDDDKTLLIAYRGPRPAMADPHG